MSTDLTSASRENPAPHALRVILGISLFALAGCTSADEAMNGERSSQCEEHVVNIDRLPGDVLVGTDIVDSASFDDSDASLAGQYLGETGGASLGAMINTNFAERQFNEPGSEAHNRTFQPICIDGPYLSAEGLVVRRVTEGVLWLERDSGVEGLPADMWLLLEPLK